MLERTGAILISPFGVAVLSGLVGIGHLKLF
jgi:hypothetical protein